MAHTRKKVTAAAHNEQHDKAVDDQHVPVDGATALIAESTSILGHTSSKSVSNSVVP